MRKNGRQQRKVFATACSEEYLNAQGSAFSVEEATKIALDEMKKKSEIVRESGISVQVKRGTFCYVEAMLKELKEHSL